MAARYPPTSERSTPAVVARRQPRQRQRAEHQAEVAQGDVVVARVREQVDDDAAQPRGDQVGAVTRAHGDDEPGDDLDHADGVHEVARAAGDDVVDPGRQVLGPVDHHVGELVDAEEDRRDREADAQEGEGLEGGIAAQAGRRGGTGRRAGAERGCGHETSPLNRGFARLASPWRRVLRRRVAGEEVAQAVVILAAGGAALEVGAHAGHRGVGVCAGELELDEAVELVEARLAGQLRLHWAEQAADVIAVHGASSPRSASAERSRRRASCKVLYRAPRVVAIRSASTSIGTSLSAMATRTSRWWAVRSRAIASRMAASSSVIWASRCGAADGSASAGQPAGSKLTSRSCQARRRIFTPASSSANLYAQGVKRLSPRKSSSLPSTATSASCALWCARSSSSRPVTWRAVAARRWTSKRAARSSRSCSRATASSRTSSSVARSASSHSRDSVSVVGSARVSTSPFATAAPAVLPTTGGAARAHSLVAGLALLLDLGEARPNSARSAHARRRGAA